MLSLATATGGWLIARLHRASQESLTFSSAADAVLWNAVVWSVWNFVWGAWGYWQHRNAAGPPFGLLRVVVAVTPLVAGTVCLLVGGLWGASSDGDVAVGPRANE